MSLCFLENAPCGLSPTNGKLHKQNRVHCGPVCFVLGLVAGNNHARAERVDHVPNISVRVIRYPQPFQGGRRSLHVSLNCDVVLNQAR